MKPTIWILNLMKKIKSPSLAITLALLTAQPSSMPTWGDRKEQWQSQGKRKKPQVR